MAYFSYESNLKRDILKFAYCMCSIWNEICWKSKAVEISLFHASKHWLISECNSILICTALNVLLFTQCANGEDISMKLFLNWYGYDFWWPWCICLPWTNNSFVFIQMCFISFSGLVNAFNKNIVPRSFKHMFVYLAYC